MAPVPLCSSCAALTFDDIGPLIPNQLNPVKKQKQKEDSKVIADYQWLMIEETLWYAIITIIIIFFVIYWLCIPCRKFSIKN